MQNPYSLTVIGDPEHYRQRIAAQKEQRLVDLAAAIPSLRMDIKYASTDNFTGEQLYPQPRAYLRQPAAEALRAAQQALSEKGLGICIFDAYRPYSVTLKLWEYLRDERYVAAPWTGSRHNRGCAVDMTLVDLASGETLAMPTGYDDFSERAGHHYTDLPETVLHNRKVLVSVMRKHGFAPLPSEWWHYDFNGWENYALLNLPFAVLDNY
jgi:D-alanyl-D-alanine dipeptidase